jgi:hypothetical protein
MASGFGNAFTDSINPQQDALLHQTRLLPAVRAATVIDATDDTAAAMAAT